MAYGALKLSALHFPPIDHFVINIFEISRRNCIISMINCTSSRSFNLNLYKPGVFRISSKLITRWCSTKIFRHTCVPRGYRGHCGCPLSLAFADFTCEHVIVLNSPFFQNCLFVGIGVTLRMYMSVKNNEL